MYVHVCITKKSRWYLWAEELTTVKHELQYTPSHLLQLTSAASLHSLQNILAVLPGNSVRVVMAYTVEPNRKMALTFSSISCKEHFFLEVLFYSIFSCLDICGSTEHRGNTYSGNQIIVSTIHHTKRYCALIITLYIYPCFCTLGNS